jgi:hypothetical protein
MKKSILIGSLLQLYVLSVHAADSVTITNNLVNNDLAVELVVPVPGYYNLVGMWVRPSERTVEGKTIKVFTTESLEIPRELRDKEDIKIRFMVPGKSKDVLLAKGAHYIVNKPFLDKLETNVPYSNMRKN